MVSREGASADGLAETGMGAVETARSEKTTAGCERVRDSEHAPETGSGGKSTRPAADAEAVAGRVQGWQRGGAVVVLFSALRLWCRAEDPQIKINECGY